MEYRFSDRMQGISGNAIREIFKLLDNPEVVSFAGGMPATDCLPVAQFRQMCDRLLSSPDAPVLLQYGATEGYLPLRRRLAEFVGRCGIGGISEDNVLVVTWGQQGIDLTYKIFINPGDAVLVEDPTYLAALHIAKTYQARAIGVRSGEEGIELEDLEAKIKAEHPKIFYIVPNFSNPTGKTLSAEKRKAIAELCAAHGVMVLEDDPYRELRYSGEPLPAIKSFDRAGNCIYLFSFSKTISPAMRVGAVVAEPEVIRKLTVGKQATDVHTATLLQAVAYEFIKDDTLDQQIARSVPLYREKRDVMLEALDRCMPASFTHTRPEGGLFIWGEFDPASKISAKAKFREAVENKVAYVCGNDFFADGRGDNCVRLNFSNETAERIVLGCERLGKLFG